MRLSPPHLGSTSTQTGPGDGVAVMKSVQVYNHLEHDFIVLTR